MFDGLLDYLQNAGALGKGALLVGLLLIVAGAVMITGRSTRTRFAVFLALALLPLALGAIGAAVGPSVLDQVPASGGTYTPEQLEAGRANAAIPLEIGAAFTGLLLIVGAVGVFLAGEARSRNGAAPAS